MVQLATEEELRLQRYEQEEQAAIAKQLNRWQRRAAFQRPTKPNEVATPIPAWLTEDAHNCKKAWRVRREVVGSAAHTERLTPDGVLQAAREAAASARAVVDKVTAAPPASVTVAVPLEWQAAKGSTSSSNRGLVGLLSPFTIIVVGLVLLVLAFNPPAAVTGRCQAVVLALLLCHFILRFVYFVERGGSTVPVRVDGLPPRSAQPGKVSPSARPGRAVRVPSRESESVV